ncbi:hypothetical protein [Chitinimonas sp.]|uniref:hypothetical protein n=1 Tax=Chitinimonas sp. TaxID=1934313 RepID=UPI0035AF7492
MSKFIESLRSMKRTTFAEVKAEAAKRRTHSHGVVAFEADVVLTSPKLESTQQPASQPKRKLKFG